MIALVGYTGFVGSNICHVAGKEITGLYNSRNIEIAYKSNPDILIYAGLRAEKYLANNAPKKDMALIVQAEVNIEKINPKQLILISTVDVFKTPKNVDETSRVDTDGLNAYGYNRYQFECWVRERYPHALIIRLPALFGKNIKKNFIYDYLNIIPTMLKKDKFFELSRKEPALKNYYFSQENGFYKVNISLSEKMYLQSLFRRIGFTALNFTDSRSAFQFYDLSRLWSDIKTAMGAQLKLWHPATEPVTAGEIYEYLTGNAFINELDGAPVEYDYRTVYDSLFKGASGYIADKNEVLYNIKNFVEGNM